METVVGFVPALLTIIEGAGFGESEKHIRQAAAVMFKNFIKNNWPNDYCPALQPADRASLRATIVDRMTAVPEQALQIQLAEAIVQMAAVDFPQAWPELIGMLAGKLSPSEHAQNQAVLRTLHYIFKRYRTEGRTDELFSEINFVMGQFAPALLQLYGSLETSLANSNGNVRLMEQIVVSMTFCNKIFYSLSSQDLPAFFEDRLREFMDIFKRHYALDIPLLEAEGDEETEGPMERLRVSVAEIINLYASKYEEDFPMLPEFVELSWVVLTTRVQPQPRFDRLAGAAMAFLATVAKQAQHRELFGPVLQLISDKIILPNLLFRDGDLELFEDEPVEFMRREQDLMAAGMEELSRRSAAVLLTRGLMESYESQVTTILGTYIQQYLQQYATAPASRWREKNVATQLFSAIAIKGSVQAYGVTRVNPMVNLVEFFHTNILPDLQLANEALHPILKMDAIRFVHQFRGQLPRQDLHSAFPLLMHHVASHNHVIHTFAAMAIERILAQRGTFSPADILGLVRPLCESLSQLLMSKKGSARLADNEMLMKALMRVMLLGEREGMTPNAPRLADSLCELAWEVVRHPANPRFNHYLFEALMALIRYCGPDPAIMALLESKLLSLFQEIIQADLMDFLPYLLQLYAGMVEAGTASILPAYATELLQVVLQPALWTTPANVPALIRFIQACLLKGADSPALLTPVLGVIQVLLGSRVNDLHGFALLHTLLQVTPPPVIEPVLQQITLLLLKKLQAQKNSRTASALLQALCQMTLCLGAGKVFTLLESIQQRMVVGLMKGTLLPEGLRIRNPDDRRAVSMALCQWLVDCKELSTRLGEADYRSLWLAILSTLLGMLANIPASGTQTNAASEEIGLYETAKDEEILPSSGSGFARLQVLLPAPHFASIPASADPAASLATGLQQLSRSLPGGMLQGAVDAELEVNHRNVLHALLQQFNSSL